MAFYYYFYTMDKVSVPLGGASRETQGGGRNEDGSRVMLSGVTFVLWILKDLQYPFSMQRLPEENEHVLDEDLLFFPTERYITHT